MTHRVFSRNGRSSRAVPVATLLKEDPYMPHFMANEPGMRASQEMSDEDRAKAESIWMGMVEVCKEGVRLLGELKVHKQWANRPLEWFGYIDVLVSSTDWANFFELRDEIGAQPEMDELAKAVREALDASTPARCVPGAWHLPYIDYSVDIRLVSEYLNKTNPGWDRNLSLQQEGEAIQEILKKVSVARCARLTIKPFDGDGSIEKELSRYELLMVSRPVHASPAEHVATPDGWHSNEYCERAWDNEHEHGNFYGWRQFRKMIPYNTIYDR